MVKYWFWGHSIKIFNRNRTICLKDELFKKRSLLYVHAPKNAEEVLHEQTVLVTKDMRNNNQTAEHWQTGVFWIDPRKWVLL